jgi:hypothetical protein
VCAANRELLASRGMTGAHNKGDKRDIIECLFPRRNFLSRSLPPYPSMLVCQHLTYSHMFPTAYTDLQPYVAGISFQQVRRADRLKTLGDQIAGLWDRLKVRSPPSSPPSLPPSLPPSFTPSLPPCLSLHVLHSISFHRTWQLSIDTRTLFLFFLGRPPGCVR